MILRIALFASLLLAAVVPAGAQSPAPASSAAAPAASPSPPASAEPAASSTAASSTAAPASSAKPAAADSADPSPEVIKMARKEGFKPKKRNGVTQFCYSDASLGTHFVSEKCYSEQQMENLVQDRKDQRNQLGQPGACTGCSGH